MTERATLDLTPRRDVTMWHTCLVIGPDKEPAAVSITTNPLHHTAYAQVVMHKTRSHSCAVQVARYVRRTFGITEPVATIRAPRAIEAMIGYACAGGMQHAPTERTPGWGVFQHIALTPIRDLLSEVAGGHSAASTRYVVYEVRCGSDALRGVTNKFHALEDRYRRCPPDAFGDRPVEFVMIGRYETSIDALATASCKPSASDRLWTRKPPADYVRRHLRLEHGAIVWACDGEPAVREYDFRAVVLGPHVYTEAQILGVLEHGTWVDGRTREGRASTR